MNTDAHLEREARETFLGRLGDPEGINVAKVEVSWHYEDPGLGFETRIEEHAGHFLVHATGNEPECEGEDGTIYAVFERLVGEAMARRQQQQGFAGWQIDDTYAS